MKNHRINDEAPDSASSAARDISHELFPVCAQCGSISISEVSYGDEGLTVCRSCGTVEGGYDWVSEEEYEEAPNGD